MPTNATKDVGARLRIARGPYLKAVMDDHPISVWPLDESSGTVANDLGSGGNTGTYTGTYTQGAGAPQDGTGNVALSLAGAGKVTAGTAGIPSGSSARTVESWIRPTGVGGCIVACNAASGQKFFVEDFSSGGINLFSDGVNVGNNIVLTGSEIPLSDSWSHIAFVLTSSTTWEYYLNGFKKKTGSFGTAINTSALTSVWIGDRSDFSQPWNGRLFAPAVYGYALTAAQIQAHFNAAMLYRDVGWRFRLSVPTPQTRDAGWRFQVETPHKDVRSRFPLIVRSLKDGRARFKIASGAYQKAVLDDNPFVYLPLDESSGTTAADLSGNGRDGTYHSVTLGTASPIHPGGAAATFNGTSSYVSVPLDLSAVDKVTLEFWLKVASWPGGDALAAEFTSNYNSNNGGFIVDPNAAAPLDVGMHDGAGYALNDGARPSAGAWHHYVLKFDRSAAAGSQIEVWLDAQKRATSDSGANVTGNFDNSTLYLMSRGGGALFLAGDMDEVALYTSLLSPSRIQAHFNAAQQYRDAAARTSVSAQSFRDAAARFTVRTLATYKDAAARLRVVVRRYNDAPARFTVGLPYYRDAGWRLRVNAPPAAPSIDSGTPVNPNVYPRQGFSLKATATDPGGDTIRYEWSYSGDSGSTWTVAGSTSYVASGAQGVYGWTPPLALSGTVRLRVRAQDDGGAYSAYTTQGADWTLTDRPVAVPIGPAGVVNLAAAQTFSWTYTSAASSAQTAYALRRRHTVTGLTQWWRASDSTWQSAETWNATATPSATVGANAWTTHRGDVYAWSVAVKDSHTVALVSAYSAELLTTWSQPVDPTITDPTAGGPAIATATYTVVWTVSEQQRFRVRLLAGATVLADSGIVADPAARSYAIGPAAPGSVTYELTTWNDEQYPSDVQTVAKTVTFSAPPNQPVATGSALLGPLRVHIAISNPAGGTGVTGNEVWRSTAGSGGPYTRIATGVAVDGSYDDPAVSPNTSYWYFVRAIGSNGTYRDSA